MHYRVAGAPVNLRGVEVNFDAKSRFLKASSKSGSCSVFIPSEFSCLIENENVRVVQRDGGEKADGSKLALWGCLSRKIANAIGGCLEPYRAQLVLNGTGYKAQVLKILERQFICLTLGFSHDVYIEIPKGLSINCPKTTVVEILGADKQDVGGFASRIYKIRPVEPYKGRGIYIVGKFVYRKEAKRK